MLTRDWRPVLMVFIAWWMMTGRRVGMILVIVWLILDSRLSTIGAVDGIIFVVDDSGGMAIMLVIVLMIMIAVHLDMDVSNRPSSMTALRHGVACMELPTAWKCVHPLPPAQLAHV